MVRSTLPRLPSFSFTAPPPTVIYTLSLHDALPICQVDHAEPQLHLRSRRGVQQIVHADAEVEQMPRHRRGQSAARRDRKSTRLNSSHEWISYAVFCLKKKKKKQSPHRKQTMPYPAA